MKWEDITLRKFKEIQSILEVEDEYMVLNLVDTIYNVDSASLPISEFKKYNIEFLKQPVPKVELKNEYTLNGRVYNSNFDLTVVTASQFIDYQNYCKEEQPDFSKLLSVFFIPEGHKYNDGYDMKQVQEDLLDLDICTVQSASFFFGKQLAVFANLFQRYLIKTVKKMKLPKAKKKELLQKLSEMDLANLVYYHLYLNSVK